MSTTTLQPNVWAIAAGPGVDAAAARVASLGAQVAIVVDANEALAGPGDYVVLSGLTPAQTVAAAELIRARGATAVVDLADLPALRRALGRTWRGLAAVVLEPDRETRADRTLTRVRDALAAGAGLIALAPLLFGLALLVRLTSRGPATFSTTVVGEGGRPFRWHKLRSMRVRPGDDVDRRTNFAAFMAEPKGRKVIDRSRVTPLGRVLRRHSLDELPQLWNVLRGEMALVGPRPCLPYEYELQQPWHRLRYRVRPGLTGPWQAFGRGRVTFDEMALTDYCYSRARSFWVDTRLIGRTVLVVLTGEGGV